MRIVQSIPRDSIPAVDDPTFSLEYDGDPDDQMIVLEPDEGSARAYPTGYLDFHEVVNDHLDDRPVAVTWCPLCGSAIVYEATVDGTPLTFGVSGKLADDNLVLYDRETGSEWKQSTGQCIAGPLAGARLAIRPSTVTTYRALREAYDEPQILEPPGGRSISSGPDRDAATIDYSEDPFGSYVESDAVGRDAFYDLIGRDPDEHYQGPRDWDRDDLGPKEPVLGLTLGEPIAFPRSQLEAAGGVVQTSIDGRDVLVVATLDGLHAYADPGASFESESDGVLRADGTTWNGATGVARDGRRLERLPGVRAFAFVWQDDHGPDAFYHPD